MSKHNFKAGDRVAMSSKWLKSTQAHDMGNLRGTVFYTGDMVVSVQWDNSRVSGVLASNLVLAERVHLEPA
jgi:hypothetical protein